ncbi:GNAT family N-acetyltransferase [Lacticaseibacillus jixianensis]|uniref:GNAT family N-acetyltransferase n=1 Tax=Lacticaseibacillus jixianensis TaxID=2486012 RepID=A0ABW4B857_9LACO|nr:GNAT family N-acetyltransferase [Lacticaseibacillus jixianensis]
MTINFSLATAQDLPRIVAIYNQIIPSRLATADLTPVSVASRKAWFAAFDPARRPLWVMQSAGRCIGWVGLEDFYGRPAYLHTAEVSIYIDQAFRHQHVGQQALDFVFTQLPRLGLNALVAFIFAHNQPSLALFGHNGFERWGLLPDVAELDGCRRSLAIMGRRFN